MALTFEFGDPDRPRGHALLYFHSAAGRRVLATYLLVPPVHFDPARYIPPIFAPRLAAHPGTVAAFAWPPIPEPVESVAWVRAQARARGDDLLYGGTVAADDPERLLVATHEVLEEYARRCTAALAEAVEAEPAPASEPALTPEDEEALRYLLLAEKERLGELARLTGQLRYALEGGDRHLAAETLHRMGLLGRHLPAKYRIPEFLAAAQLPGDRGRRLAELYLERCYKLCDEEYEALPALDREIEALKGS